MELEAQGNSKANMKKIFFILPLLFLSIATPASANNLRIENFNVSQINTDANQIVYQCDISWDNSWNNSTNHDAIWVFVKFSVDGGKQWFHASMSTTGMNPIGFKADGAFDVYVPNDEKGFFIKRSDFGQGTSLAKNVEFVWDYQQDGLSDAEASAASTVNKIFGIEMVYIPEGAFYAGDGQSSSDYRFVQGSADNDPWYINSEKAITTTQAASNGFYYQSAGLTGENASGDVFLIPDSFPKGYQAFYMMKYELTELQWVDFFNTLSASAKINRDITSTFEGGKKSDLIVDRNTISWDHIQMNSIATTQRPYRPVTYISWPDLTAYADWAALRPATELEFEKSARGSDIVPNKDEYAWGKTTYNQAEASEIYPDADEDGQEQLFDGAANINRNNLGWASGDGRIGGSAVGQRGPLRVGIFAESSTNRTTSGAGYYGNMELSGNLAEMIVTVGRSEGRRFLGSHGDGQLSTNPGYEGFATNLDWPGINPTNDEYGVTGTIGSGFRGGDFASSNLRLFQISTRTLATKDPDSGGYEQRNDPGLGVYQGGRLVRTAP